MTTLYIILYCIEMYHCYQTHYNALKMEYTEYLKNIGWFSELGKKNDASEFLYFLIKSILEDLEAVTGLMLLL